MRGSVWGRDGLLLSRGMAFRESRLGRIGLEQDRCGYKDGNWFFSSKVLGYRDSQLGLDRSSKGLKVGQL